MHTILITGATGEVARGVLPFLEEQFALKLLAPDVPPNDPRSVRGDILDLPFLAQAMQGIDAVLHLAIAGGHTGTFEEDEFNDRRFDINVKGTYHAFEAARRAGVRRFVHISSLMVTWGHAKNWCAVPSSSPVPGDAPANPVGTYALTKSLGEEIARYYAQQQAMEVITLRIGAPLDVAKLQPQQVVRPQQVPFPDLAQAFSRALMVPLKEYTTVSICGDSSKCPWDLEAARRVLGYQPAYCLDDMDITLIDPFAVPPNP